MNPLCLKARHQKIFYSKKLICNNKANFNVAFFKGNNFFPRDMWIIIILAKKYAKTISFVYGLFVMWLDRKINFNPPVLALYIMFPPP